MGRSFHINGESMVSAKGRSDSIIPALTQLGLSDGEITITPAGNYEDIHVDTWGARGAPVDVQYFLSHVDIHMTLIHYDETVLRFCMQESMGGGIVATGVGTEGFMPHAGSLLGNGVARFAPNGTVNAGGIITTGNHLIGLNITSPNDGLPWRFFYCYLQNPIANWPIGTTKTIVSLTWRAIPYTTDPWGVVSNIESVNYGGAGFGAFGSPLWDHTLDT